MLKLGMGGVHESAFNLDWKRMSSLSLLLLFQRLWAGLLLDKTKLEDVLKEFTWRATTINKHSGYKIYMPK